MEVVPTRCIYSVIAVISVLLVACEGGSEEIRGEPTPRSSSACAGEQSVIASGGTREGPPRAADIDGDGRDDEVRLHLDFEGPVGCQAFVVVETTEGITVEPVWTMGEAGGLPQPSLYAFSNVNGRRGFEILINEASGASTQFVAVYAFADGELVPITVPDNENGLFAFGGSVGHIEGVDCGSDDGIVISRAVPAAGRAALREELYQVRRTIYSFSAGKLAKETTELYEIPLEELGQFNEFRLGPFGTCAGP